VPARLPLLAALTILTGAAPAQAQSTPSAGGTAPASAAAPTEEAGVAVLRRVHDRYSQTRFRTLTFTQKTTFPDGRVEWWYEAERIPGHARVDIAPFDSLKTSIFRNDSAYVFARGELQRTGGPLAMTMWTLMDMYAIPPEETAEALRRRGVDMALVHEREHEGRRVIVIGAADYDTTRQQVWLDAEHLYAVRHIIPRGGHRVIDVSGHTFRDGGWVEGEIRVYLNGELQLLEEYNDIRTNVELPPGLFEPAPYLPPPWPRRQGHE